ncbi:hypothetical protein C5E06_09440 [Pseudoclavibacter sp. RFBI5]|uniref:hypothetical protein n=1 Tax=Pseudoclavibacter sp. RFBI5 TaxID=2080578 RepID=UPI000CE87DD9|nr:hypothetical protein [Pseudoclavibacter sp. RFBI5]PPG02666.1 hypothetical protein C5E06_09440 [Pseudoclavibacter sp. RFBI5]
MSWSLITKVANFVSRGSRKPSKMPSRAPGEDDKYELSDERLVSSMLDAVGSWPRWCHRRIDRYEPTDGNRGRLKHSIDMTLPSDPHFAYDPSQRGLKSSGDVKGQVLAPIAIVEKKPLHEFDVDVVGTKSVPTLTRRENERLTVAILSLAYARTLGVAVRDLDPLLIDALKHIVGNSDNAHEVAVALTEHGLYGEHDVIDHRLIGSKLATFTRDLSTGFIMYLLLPATKLGARSLVKVSYLWSTNSTGGIKWLQLLASAHQLYLPLTAPSDAESYHLEFVVPSGVACTVLTLPKGSDSDGRHAALQRNDTSAHVHAKFLSAPARDGLVELTSLGSPAHLQAGLFLTFTASVLLAFAAWGDPIGLASSGGSAVSVLLSFPALLFGISAARHGSTLADNLAMPFRVTVGLCALLFFIFAASPVLIATGTSLEFAWWFLALAASVGWLLFLVQTLVAFIWFLTRSARLGKY